ncbi:MAG: T9SS type A sorting domain-containing protein, partial [Bacteroidia bacterium]|nr:T9SS type A sorting domain-containing protein [Bacteroidia bacterium]
LADNWLIETIFASNIHTVGVNADVKIRADGMPVVAARHETLNRIVLAYKKEGSWQYVEFDENPGGDVGTPVRLALDDDGRALIFYGFYNLNYDFRAACKNLDTGEEFTVILPDNPDGFGADFWAGMHQNTPYLFGRTHTPGATGLTMIIGDDWRQSLISDISITDLQTPPVRFYPNPVADEAVVDVPFAFVADVFDIRGTLKFKFSGAGSTRVDFSDLPAGMYWCAIEAAGKRTVVRFVKR